MLQNFSNCVAFPFNHLNLGILFFKREGGQKNIGRTWSFAPPPPRFGKRPKSYRYFFDHPSLIEIIWTQGPASHRPVSLNWSDICGKASVVIIVLHYILITGMIIWTQGQLLWFHWCLPPWHLPVCQYLQVHRRWRRLGMKILFILVLYIFA